MTTVRDVMTAEPLTLDAGETLVAAARQMRDADVGDVIVTEQGTVKGIVTDRDITVRGVAEALDPSAATLSQIVTRDLVTVRPDDDLQAAADLMRTYAVRRLPVVDDGDLVGVVSLGDLAVDRDPDSVLADISADEPNN
ncbi:MAG TPA: CBS domain-containing protein [Catenuloplanes sp.]